MTTTLKQKNNKASFKTGFDEMLTLVVKPGFLMKTMPEQEHQKFMKIAIALSAKNVRDGSGGPFGAVIVKNGTAIAQSANNVLSEIDPTAHAEISAIRLACKQLNTYDLSGCVIYSSCEPCPMCLGAIYWAKISRVYYANSKHDAAGIGFDDDMIYKEIESEMKNRKLPFTQLMRNEAMIEFNLWKEYNLNKDH